MLEMKDRRPDFAKDDPLFSMMPDNRCRIPGTYTMDTRSTGKNLMQKEQNRTRNGW
jgi:hypothetical protein